MTLPFINTWPLTPSNYPRTFIPSSFKFCSAVILCYFTFSTFLPSAVSLHRLICFFFFLFFSSLFPSEINMAAAAWKTTWWPTAYNVCPVISISLIFQQTRDHTELVTASRAPFGLCELLKGMAMCGIKWEKSHTCQVLNKEHSHILRSSRFSLGQKWVIPVDKGFYLSFIYLIWLKTTQIRLSLNITVAWHYLINSHFLKAQVILQRIHNQTVFNLN